MGFTLSSGQNSGQTLVPDTFIQKFMPTADGNFVKIYLFLRMLCQKPSSDDLSVSFLADEMECTEKDILRGLHYWQREGLLELKEDGGELSAVTFTDMEKTDKHISSPAPVKEPALTKEPTSEKVANLPPVSARTLEFTVPSKQTYTPMQADALMKDSEIDHAIDSVEKILGEPISPAHLQTILYFMCDVGFSSDLLITLYKVAVGKGKKQPNYIEAIGINWASQGITTPEEAQEEAANFSGRYALVSQAFGIQGSLKPAQREIVDGWNSYHFADSIIAEACKRTVLQTGDANFQYTSKILDNWHKKQVSSLQDIEKCDESYKNQKKAAQNSQKAAPRKNQFQNFPQRSYSQNDYDSLEKKLLRGQRN